VSARISPKVAVGVVFVAAMFMSIMDATIVNVALPTIGRDFGVSPTAVDAISIAFLVSLAVFIPASGWLGDRLGGKRVLLAAIAVFTVALVLCGLLVTGLSWRWVFFVNLPIGVAAFTFGAVFLRQQAQARPGRFDLAGFLLSGLGLLMYGVAEGPNLGWHQTQVCAAIAVGVVLLAAMTFVELRSAAPMVDLRLLKNRLFRAGNGVMVLASVAFLGTLYAISLYYQDGRGLSALGWGLSTFPEALGVMAGAQLASRVFVPEARPPSPHHHRADRDRGIDRPARADGTADQPVVGAAAHTDAGAIHGAGVRPGSGGGVRHDNAGGHRPGVHHVQRDQATRRRGRRGRADHCHRVGRAGAPGQRAHGGQPDGLPCRLPGRRRHLLVRRGVVAVHSRRRRRRHDPRSARPGRGAVGSRAVGHGLTSRPGGLG
jgi:MFS family permease